MRSMAKDDNAAGRRQQAGRRALDLPATTASWATSALSASLAGNPDLDKNLEGMIKLFTQGQGLKGLDRNRPWGITLTTDGLVVSAADLPAGRQLEGFARCAGGPDRRCPGRGQRRLRAECLQPKDLRQRDQDQWAFISMSPDALADVPKDPTKLLGGLDKIVRRCVAAERAKHSRTVSLAGRRSVADGRRVGPGPDAGRKRRRLRRAQERWSTGQIEALTTAINEIDQLTLGWALDTSAKTTHIDLTVAAVAGSDFGKQLSQVKETTSDFAGFLVPDAAASLNLSAKMDKDNTEQFVAALQTLRSHALQHIEAEEKLSDDATKKIAKEMVSEVFDAIQATVESGKIDAGATLNLSDKSMALVAGAYVADPNSLEDALKKFAKLAEKEPNFPGIKFDADKHGGVRFHTASLPVPKEEGISRVLGDKLDVAVGIGPKSAYLALGHRQPQAVQATDRQIQGGCQQARAAVSIERIAGADLSIRRRHARSSGSHRHGRGIGQVERQGPRPDRRDPAAQRGHVQPQGRRRRNPAVGPSRPGGHRRRFAGRAISGRRRARA